MTGNDVVTNLRPRQQAGVAALLAGVSVVQAARVTGCSERTLRRWLDTAAFQEAMREAARDSAREATTRLLAAQGEAVQTLREAMRTGTAATRVRAATVRRSCNGFPLTC